MSRTRFPEAPSSVGNPPGDPDDGVSRALAALRLPHPERISLVREVRRDLDELTRELEARGLAPEEARRRARGMLLPGGPALDALERVHRPLYVRITDRFTPDRMRRYERTAFVGFATLAVVGTLAALARADLLEAPSRFLAPVLALGALAVAVAAAKAFQLFVKRDHPGGRLRSGLGLVPALAGCVLAVAAAGFLVDLYALAARMEAGPPDPGAVLLAFVASASALLASGLVLALLAALLWFVLVRWIAGAEHAEREVGIEAAVSQLPPQEVPQ